MSCPRAAWAGSQGTDHLLQPAHFQRNDYVQHIHPRAHQIILRIIGFIRGSPPNIFAREILFHRGSPLSRSHAPRTSHRRVPRLLRHSFSDCGSHVIRLTSHSQRLTSSASTGTHDHQTSGPAEHDQIAAIQVWDFPDAVHTSDIHSTHRSDSPGFAPTLATDKAADYLPYHNQGRHHLLEYPARH